MFKRIILGMTLILGLAPHSYAAAPTPEATAVAQCTTHAALRAQYPQFFTQGMLKGTMTRLNDPVINASPYKDLVPARYIELIESEIAACRSLADLKAQFPEFFTNDATKYELVRFDSTIDTSKYILNAFNTIAQQEADEYMRQHNLNTPAAFDAHAGFVGHKNKQKKFNAYSPCTTACSKPCLVAQHKTAFNTRYSEFKKTSDDAALAAHYNAKSPEELARIATARDTIESLKVRFPQHFSELGIAQRCPDHSQALSMCDAATCTFKERHAAVKDRYDLLVHCIDDRKPLRPLTNSELTLDSLLDKSDPFLYPKTSPTKKNTGFDFLQAVRNFLIPPHATDPNSIDYTRASAHWALIGGVAGLLAALEAEYSQAAKELNKKYKTARATLFKQTSEIAAASAENHDINTVATDALSEQQLVVALKKLKRPTSSQIFARAWKNFKKKSMSAKKLWIASGLALFGGAGATGYLWKNSTAAATA